jgi:hypothetical protein
LSRRDGGAQENGWADVFPVVDSVVQSDVRPLLFQLGAADSLAVTFKRAGFAKGATHRLSLAIDYTSERDAPRRRSRISRFDRRLPARRWRICDPGGIRRRNRLEIVTSAPFIRT